MLTASKSESVVSERSEERSEDMAIESKKVAPEIRKKVEPVKTSPVVTSRKSKVKKSGSKPKLSSQSSVNDEMETSSTTTESSNPEELMEPFAKGITISSTSSESPTISNPEQSKKKKKTKTKTVESEPAREQKAKAKKPLERAESKPERIEKTRLSTKSSSELTSKPQPSSPLPQPKQEAKVKGVPKEDTNILRRQQSAPAYSPPPRLQGHGGQQLPLRSLGDQGRSSPGQAENFIQKQDRPEPPRAIILPEMKQNPGSQFGPIGCKVPREREHLSKSTWQDSPAAPGPMGHHESQARSMSMAPLGRQAPVPTPLLPPPGLTIMQQLQAERRQREEEYVRRQNNWPGFGDSAAVSHQQPVGPVAATHPEVGRDVYVESLWDQPGGGQTQGQQGLWGTIGNVWPSTVFNSAGFRYQGKARQGTPGQPRRPRLSLTTVLVSAPFGRRLGINSKRGRTTPGAVFSTTTRRTSNSLQALLIHA